MRNIHIHIRNTSYKYMEQNTIQKLLCKAKDSDETHRYNLENKTLNRCLILIINFV